MATLTSKETDRTLYNKELSEINWWPSYSKDGSVYTSLTKTFTFKVNETVDKGLTYRLVYSGKKILALFRSTGTTSTIYELEDYKTFVEVEDRIIKQLALDYDQIGWNKDKTIYDT